MYSRLPPGMLKKRPNENPGIERPKKSPFGSVKVENDSLNDAKTFRFRILLPNGTTLELKMHESRKEMPIEEFIVAVKKEYDNVVKEKGSTEPKSRINWKYPDLHFTDAHEKKIALKVNFQDLVPNKWQILRLYDGTAEPETFEDMWDLTPDTELLKELPNEYTYETALADLIDNSLQALWDNRRGDKRLISVELLENKISIFDSGPGMDGTDGKIVKWGKMGSSLNRTSRPHAVGGEPPYLMPYFGMFGYGGPVATMHLGSRALVASKTRSCNKVFTLYLERDALISSSHQENCWKTKGGMRNPLPDEKKKSPHGSFTKVEISDLKLKSPDAKLLQCRLKDIYFPYIQCDEMHGKTSRPIEFQVNGMDLAEIEGGEVATTNLHSCNGPDFVLQLHFSFVQDASPAFTQKEKVSLEANARLKCVYFPVIEGEESIGKIIKKLEEDGYGIRESYEGFSRVSIRRLGRLLPDSRWAWLPFMEPKQRKGERAQILKRCCFRVKCFVDTDAGFNPTPPKTDLAHQHPYTLALKNFGNDTHGNENDVQVEVYRDGKKLNISQLEKQYHDWLLQMHERYDEEIDAGVDEPTLVVVSKKDKKLGINSDVVRVHKEIRRKGANWKAGQKIKVLKGACTGCHKNNVFATIEYFLLSGLQGDTCGEARLICRPVDVAEDKGCRINADSIDLVKSVSFPISIIDSGKCLEVDDTEWKNKVEMNDQKLPSFIELLNPEDCQQLEIEGDLINDEVEAGDAPPDQIVSVVRPKAVNSSKNYNRLDQKFIVREKFEMVLNVSFRAGDKKVGNPEHLCAVRKEASSHKGLHGLYIFPLRLKMPVFQKAGLYTFSFYLDGMKNVRFAQVVQVKAAAELCSWRVTSDKQNVRPTVRVGSRFPPLYVACYDQYDNSVPLASIPELTIELNSKGSVLAEVSNVNMSLTAEKSTMKIEDIFIKSCHLDKIRPNYNANLHISTPDGEFSVDYPCQVIPGTPQKITVHPKQIKRQLLPGQIIEKLVLEVFDSYGNHVKEDEIISLYVDGFSFQDGTNVVRKVDAKGCLDLSNILKVSVGYGEDVLLCIISGKKTILQLEFQTEIRELQTATKVFENCQAGSQLENISFEITDSKGVVDESINDDERNGKIHTLKIKSETFPVDDSVRYSFRNGRCCIRSIPLPETEGVFSFTASHSHYPELKLEIEVHVEKFSEENHDNNNMGIPENFEFSPQVPSGNLSVLTQTQPISFKKQESRRGSFSMKRAIVPFDCSPLKSPKPETPVGRMYSIQDSFSQNREKISGYSSVGRTYPNHDSGSQNFAGDSSVSLKDLEDDLADWGLRVGKRTDTLKVLEFRRSAIQQHISDLQASMDRDSRYSTSASEKELILKQIETRSDSAAAIICKALKESEDMTGDILGVVTLLGTVPTIELSRMLAQYLGEDCMLAIVCKDYETADSLETHTLHKFAAKFGLSISGRYQVLCLENISPITKEPSNNPQDSLLLPMPALSNGRKPEGFLEYAVNMINIEASHIQWRTKSGHGLRETLFYRLLGELQVYENKEYLKLARSCIKDGAISLDGGIVRGNGLLSLGNWEPDIYFPVRSPMPLSSRSVETFRQMETKQLELIEVNSQIEQEYKLFEEETENLQISRKRYLDVRDGNAAERSSRRKP